MLYNENSTAGANSFRGGCRFGGVSGVFRGPLQTSDAGEVHDVGRVMSSILGLGIFRVC